MLVQGFIKFRFFFKLNGWPHLSSSQFLSIRFAASNHQQTIWHSKVIENSWFLCQLQIHLAPPETLPWRMKAESFLNFGTVFLTTVKSGKSRKAHCSPPLVGEDKFTVTRGWKWHLVRDKNHLIFLSPVSLKHFYRGIRDLAEGSKLYDLKRHHNKAGCKTQIRSYIT